jgi:hypothetical protein
MGARIVYSIYALTPENPKPITNQSRNAGIPSPKQELSDLHIHRDIGQTK